MLQKVHEKWNSNVSFVNFLKSIQFLKINCLLILFEGQRAGERSLFCWIAPQMLWQSRLGGLNKEPGPQSEYKDPALTHHHCCKWCILTEMQYLEMWVHQQVMCQTPTENTNFPWAIWTSLKYTVYTKNYKNIYQNKLI